jgi:hypothetical protein
VPVNYTARCFGGSCATFFGLRLLTLCIFSFKHLLRQVQITIPTTTTTIITVLISSSFSS